MTVLVIGSGGQIGDAVAARLAAKARPVICVSRSGTQDQRPGVVYAKADRNAPEYIATLITQHKIDTVIDVVAYDEPSTRKLISALPDRVQHYVLLSSCDVYQNYGLLHRLDVGVADQGALTEDAALRKRRFPYRGKTLREPDDPQRWLDDYDKIPIEQTARRIDIPLTILRLPMVFGPGDRQRRFRWAIGPMLAGKRVLNVPQNWLDWTTTYGFIENVAAAVVHAIDAPAAKDAIFNITDFEAVSHQVWIQRFASALGWTGDVRTKLEVSHPLAQAAAALDLSVPLKLSGERYVTETGFNAPIDLSEAITRTLEAERN